MAAMNGGTAGGMLIREDADHRLDTFPSGDPLPCGSKVVTEEFQDRRLDLSVYGRSVNARRIAAYLRRFSLHGGRAYVDNHEMATGQSLVFRRCDKTVANPTVFTAPESLLCSGRNRRLASPQPEGRRSEKEPQVDRTRRSPSVAGAGA